MGVIAGVEGGSGNGGEQLLHDMRSEWATAMIDEEK